MQISPLVPIQNREGLFAVVSQDVANTLVKGRMRLYVQDDAIVVETITRNRRPLTAYGPYLVALVAVDQNGVLRTSP